MVPSSPARPSGRPDDGHSDDGVAPGPHPDDRSSEAARAEEAVEAALATIDGIAADARPDLRPSRASRRAVTVVEAILAARSPSPGPGADRSNR